jgi:hypothetical protein
LYVVIFTRIFIRRASPWPRMITSRVYRTTFCKPKTGLHL